MPVASGQSFKYAWMDHDPPNVDIDPPTINVWYEVYHAYDVRQLQMAVKYIDDEETGATIEIKWTCDGNVYEGSINADDNTQYYWYKTKYSAGHPAALGADGFPSDGPMGYRDKRALDFKVEIRVTSAVGTNAHLYGYALYETLEVT